MHQRNLRLLEDAGQRRSRRSRRFWRGKKRGWRQMSFLYVNWFDQLFHHFILCFRYRIVRIGQSRRWWLLDNSALASVMDIRWCKAIDRSIKSDLFGARKMLQFAIRHCIALTYFLVGLVPDRAMGWFRILSAGLQTAWRWYSHQRSHPQIRGLWTWGKIFHQPGIRYGRLECVGKVQLGDMSLKISSDEMCMESCSVCWSLRDQDGSSWPISFALLSLHSVFWFPILLCLSPFPARTRWIS